MKNFWKNVSQRKKFQKEIFIQKISKKSFTEKKMFHRKIPKWIFIIVEENVSIPTWNIVVHQMDLH